MYGSVIVALNSDAWLRRKKGFVFQRYEERCEILKGLSCVSDIYAVDDSDGTVKEAISTLKPFAFAKGGDRTDMNTPELSLCKELGVNLLWNMGGAKSQSSSALIEKLWGYYEVLAEGPGYKVKRLMLMPGKATSLQSHGRRCEHWIFPASNKYRFVAQGEKHQLSAGDEELTVIEVQTGECDEEDITRYEALAQ
jgi:glycerol-3-phosphate cytidylyltransferase-like family protein